MPAWYYPRSGTGQFNYLKISQPSSNIEAELVTPTGAAVIAALAAGVGIAPDMTFTAVGYGAGTKDLPIPNLLRVLIGELAGQQYPTEELTVLEANLDDMNPELFPELQDQLLAAGALDVWLTPINMKKGRPGTMVTLRCRGTPGAERHFFCTARQYLLPCATLAREMQLVATPYGNIRQGARFRDQPSRLPQNSRMPAAPKPMVFHLRSL